MHRVKYHGQVSACDCRIGLKRRIGRPSIDHGDLVLNESWEKRGFSMER